jgi:hypothetical protein
MSTFKQFFNPAKAGLNTLATATTTGTVKLKHERFSTGGSWWSGTWEWIEGYVYVEVVLEGEEVEVGLMSNGYLDNGIDIINWYGVIPERTSLRIKSYFRPKTPSAQPDIKAGTVELEAWLESPAVSKQIKQKILSAKQLGFKFFKTKESAERWGTMI